MVCGNKTVKKPEERWKLPRSGLFLLWNPLVHSCWSICLAGTHGFLLSSNKKISEWFKDAVDTVCFFSSSPSCSVWDPYYRVWCCSTALEAGLDSRNQHAWTGGSLHSNRGAASWTVSHIICTSIATVLSQSQFYNVSMATTVSCTFGKKIFLLKCFQLC